MTVIANTAVRLLAATAALGLAGSAALAAGEAPHIERQAWAFSGITGKYDQNQLQRGFQVYKEVCASCHGLGRIALRTLAQPGGPQFPEDSVKALAATYMIKDEIKEDGKVVERPGRMADKFPPLYANEKEARSIHNGALPPDLSIMAKARGVPYHGTWYAHPFAMLKDNAVGYQ